MSIPLDVRKEIWAWFYGKRAFDYAKASCDHILKRKIEPEDPLFYPLSIGAVVCYGRPFRHSRGLEKLPAEIVPKRHEGFHKGLLTMRDKLYAHIDAADQVASPAGPTLDVLFQIDRGQVGLLCVEVPIRPEGIKRCSELCGILSRKCHYHLQRILMKHKAEFPTTQGCYRIGVSPNEPDFLKVANSIPAATEEYFH